MNQRRPSTPLQSAQEAANFVAGAFEYLEGFHRNMGRLQAGRSEPGGGGAWATPSTRLGVHMAFLGDDTLVTMTRGELKQLVAEAMRGVLARWTPPGYLDQEGAARHLGVSQETIRRWRKKGLPCYLLPPTNEGKRGVLLLKRSELDAWARKHKCS